MAYGRYNPAKGAWEFTCAGCGERVVSESDFSPLDGLDCCSPECDQVVEAEQERYLNQHPEVRAELESRGIFL